MQQREQFRLIFQIRTRGVPKRISRPAIFLMKQIADMRGIVPRDPQFFAHILVMQFSQSLGSLHTQPMHVKIFRVFPGLKQALRLTRSQRSNRHQRHSDYIQLARRFRRNEIRDAQPASFSLPWKSEAQQLFQVRCRRGRPRPCTVSSLIYDDIVPIRLRRKIPIHHLRLKQSAGNNFFFQFLFYRTELVLHQPQIVFLRRRLQLPLVLEQCRLIDVLKHFPQIEVLLHPDAPERWGRNVRSVTYYGTTLREDRPGLFIHRGGLGVLLHRPPFFQTRVARAIFGGQVFHDMQARKRVIRIKHSVGIFAPQIVLHIFAGQRRSSADHWKFQLLPLQVLDHIFHLQRGFHQQPAQPDGVRIMFHCRLDDVVARLLDPQVDYMKTIVSENDVHEVFPNVVHIAFHRRQHKSSLLRPSLLFHLGLKVGYRLLHHSGRVQHRRQLHLARPKQVADGAHPVKQDGIDQLQRRVLQQCFFK